MDQSRFYPCLVLNLVNLFFISHFVGSGSQVVTVL